MIKNLEKELKIIVSEKQFNELCSFYSLKFTSQTNIYYDTSDRKYRKQGCSIRIRTCKDIHTFTLKQKKNASSCIEYEVQVPYNHEEVFKNLEIQSLLNTFNIQESIEKIGELSTLRAVFESEDALLCFDKNTYNGTQDYEIEYEYKKDHDGEKTFNQILDKVGLKYTKNAISKSARALQ